MLDVHPAHHAASTWRDFFVHIATIALGLLLAVGLEQTVEYFHHRHQRQQFEEDIRAEAETNIRVIDSTLEINVPLHAWMAHVRYIARDAPVANGFVTFIVPAKPVTDHYNYSGSEYSTSPSHGVWTAAQSTGLVDLLPKERAQIYYRLDFEAAECLRVDGLSDVELQNYRALLRGLDINLQSGETIHLSAAQRDEFVRGIGTFLAIAHWDDVRFAFWKGASQAVLDNVKTMHDMFPYMVRATPQAPEL
jgi:hypothetical protein